MSEPVPVAPLWERQAAEKEEAWLAFRAYRDMPPDERQIKRAAIATLSTISRWYRDHNWADRVQAYDKMFDSIRVEEREAIYRRKAREVAIDHMVMLADARELITREMAKLLDASRNSEMHGLIKPADLIRLADTMTKLDRLIRGESTENVQQSSAIDYSKLSLEELDQLEKLMTKAQKDDAEEGDSVPRH